ncbi:unnamed protein product (macronuclear) [Paramecium tetraurelia]|nr:uncharacterized protein GSPATT00029215001 [Paramecium tetraurelia]CAK58179.1 unnamed protein product [Paramecium tetraurelia]|eukprot:XP_001425577.1 hypothetical protein (macronuclear) [Paramecium tetraurelia strain d4-2]
MTYDYLFKYIMVGDPGVGKTSIMLQLLGKRFGQEQKDLLGEEFGTKFIKVDDLQIKLQVWDDLWSLRYKSIPISFYRPAAGVLVVYDVIKRESFNNAQLWIQEVKDQGSQTAIIILVGNKTDLESMRQVTTEEGQQLAMEQNILFIETSAKTGYHVDDTFFIITKEIIQKLKSNQIDLLNKNCGIWKGNNVQNQITLLNQGGNRKWLGGCC